MDKLTFLLSILKYSITNPQAFKQLLQSTYQVWQDSVKENSIYKYENKKLEIEEIIHSLFPDENYSINNFKRNIQELQDHANEFFNKLQNEKYPSKTKPYPLDYSLDNKSGFFLYVLCKIMRPSKVVETGVAYGLSSMYILQALYENKNGTLYSIDYVFRPWESEQMIGSAIPSYLRSKWKLVFGPSSKKLNELLFSLGSIDIFFHDSLHTSKNMIYEFETAWPFINKKSFLISDDVSGNNVFYEFCSKLNLDFMTLLQRTEDNSFFGIVRKP